ncbi:hypothetical protein C8R46DRAFT_892830, partial [Mycena filopes]
KEPCHQSMPCSLPFIREEGFMCVPKRVIWPLVQDDTLFRSGRPTCLNIYDLFK